MSSFQGVGIEGVLISVPLYTEVSSFQGVGIEEFHCIQRCPHFRGLDRGVPLYTEVVSYLNMSVLYLHYPFLSIELNFVNFEQ